MTEENRIAELEKGNFALNNENELIRMERDDAANINERLKTALRACAARAGNPDTAEGCRQVIRTAQDALEGKEGES